MLAYFSNFEMAISHEFCGNLKSARSGLWILEGAGIGRDCRIKIFGNIMIERQTLAPDQVEKNFSRCGRAWIDGHQIPITWIAEMMVDVDPDVRRPYCCECGAQPVLNCGVERDRNIDVLDRRRWFRQQPRTRQEGVFFQHAFF